MMCPATSPTSRPRTRGSNEPLPQLRYRPPTVLVVKCFGAGEIVAGAAFGDTAPSQLGTRPRGGRHTQTVCWWVLALERSVAVASSAGVPLAPLSSSGGGDCFLRQAAEGMFGRT